MELFREAVDASFAAGRFLKKAVFYLVFSGYTALPEYGKAVNVTSRKKEVQIGAIPKNRTREVCKIVEELLGIPAREVSNYLNVTLTPSNPILHTTRLYTMFRDYEEPMVYDQNIQFYAQWTEESSEMLLACDRELQNICKKFPNLDLHQVVFRISGHQ